MERKHDEIEIVQAGDKKKKGNRSVNKRVEEECK